MMGRSTDTKLTKNNEYNNKDISMENVTNYAAMFTTFPSLIPWLLGLE